MSGNCQGGSKGEEARGCGSCQLCCPNLRAVCPNLNCCCMPCCPQQPPCCPSQQQQSQSYFKSQSDGCCGSSDPCAPPNMCALANSRRMQPCCPPPNFSCNVRGPCPTACCGAPCNQVVTCCPKPTIQPIQIWGCTPHGCCQEGEGVQKSDNGDQ